MKKIWLYLLIGVFSVCSISSCSEEYDEDDVPTIGTQYDGVYLGTLSYSIGSKGKVEVPQKIKVRKSKDAQVDLQMDNIRGEDGTLFMLTLSEVTATLSDIDSPVSLETKQEINDEDLPFSGQLAIGGNIAKDQLSLDGELYLTESKSQQVLISFNGIRQEENLSSAASVFSLEFSNATMMEGGLRILDNKGEIRIAMSKETSIADLKRLKPIFELAEGATIEPPSGVAQDFTKPVFYTVTSQDKIVKRTYEVTLFRRPQKVSFANWLVANPQAKPEEQYQLPQNTSTMSWASLDGSLAPYMGLPIIPENEYLPAKPADSWSVTASVEGNRTVGKLETLELRGNQIFGLPTIRSGMLYTGKYTWSVNNNPYENVRLGFPIHYAPIRIQGFYKYKPGKVNYECIDYQQNMTEVKPTEALDGFMVRAVLFEVSDQLAEEELLTLAEFDRNETANIVAVGEFRGYDIVEEYSPFNLSLTFKQGEKFSYSKDYCLALLFTSSFAGNRFSGAPGSILWLDELEIVTE